MASAVTASVGEGLTRWARRETVKDTPIPLKTQTVVVTSAWGLYYGIRLATTNAPHGQEWTNPQTALNCKQIMSPLAISRRRSTA
jgi:hypothetical protein